MLMVGCLGFKALCISKQQSSDKTARPCSLIRDLAVRTHRVCTLRNVLAQNEDSCLIARIYRLV